jgi:hypothetical protein
MGKLKETLPDDWQERNNWKQQRYHSFMNWLKTQNPEMYWQIEFGERRFKDEWLGVYPGDIKKKHA